jgi:anti-sigma factor RsiW
MSPTRDQHARAQELLLDRKAGVIGEKEFSWLESHLGRCPGCSEHAANLEAAVQDLRAASRDVTANRQLVRATQMRVRERAAELEALRERMSPLAVACSIACIWALGSIPLTWQGFQMLATTLHLSNAVWQGAAIFTSIAPAALITGVGIAIKRERAEG